MKVVGNRLLMGILPANPTDAYLVMSDDQGETYSEDTLTRGVGVIHEFAQVRDRIYFAADSGFMSIVAVRGNISGLIQQM